jgi:16S rRNA (guanine527-N7)-methyltransferase
MPAALDELVHGAAGLGESVSDAALFQFRAYLDTLLLWRQRISLTGASTAVEVVRFHVLDALRICPLVGLGSRVVDLGSGAGFPGVPLAIARPAATVVLVEPRRKRANFLREVVRVAGLSNAAVEEARAEDLRAALAGGCDVVVSRAVWALDVFLALARPFLRIGGVAIAMKGPKADTEVTTAPPGFVAGDIMTYELHGGVARRLLTYRAV